MDENMSDAEYLLKVAESGILLDSVTERLKKIAKGLFLIQGKKRVEKVAKKADGSTLWNGGEFWIEESAIKGLIHEIILGDIHNCGPIRNAISEVVRSSNLLFTGWGLADDKIHWVGGRNYD